MPRWDPDEILGGVADPAFATDETGLIVGWNEPAHELLGLTTDDAIGRECHEVICGRDTFGNRYCSETCAIKVMTQRSEPARHFVLSVRHASGRRLSLQVSVVRLPGSDPSRFLMLHLLTPLQFADSRPAMDGLAGPGTGAATLSTSEQDGLRSLTAREVEVLRLLASGNASQDVANELYISLTTVRTHIQNILRKLDVHSQLEAVALAFKKGLI